MHETRADRLGHPCRQDRSGARQFGQFFRGQLGKNRIQTVIGFPRAEPGEGPNDVAGLAARRQQLPAGRVTQLDGGLAERQTTVRSGREVDLPYRILGGQTQAVRGRAATGDDGLAPQGRERLDRLADTRGASSETGLDGAHVHPLANAHEVPGACETRQRLVHGCPPAQVKEGARADRRGFGQGRSMLHDPFGKASHGSIRRSDLSEI